MPYISSEIKNKWEDQEYIDPTNPGELNFALTGILQCYLNERGLSYQTLNDISGAMTECLAEFRRRVIIPYEDKKIKENGDVYDT